MSDHPFENLVGLWDPEGIEHPRPQSCVDENWSLAERKRIAAYLDAGRMDSVTMSYTPCLMCEEEMHTSTHTDGVFRWHSTLSHYVVEHAVRISEELRVHILSRLDAGKS